MKITGRIFFFALLIPLFLNLLLIFGPPPLFLLHIMGYYSWGSVLGMVAWVGVFLKSDPTLARIGMALVFVSLCIFIVLQAMTGL